jgi:hypothetical protein
VIPPARTDAGGAVIVTVDAGLDSGGVVVTGDGGAAEGGTTTGDGGGGMGTCCPDGNCLCHGPVPAKLSGTTKGPFKTASAMMMTGTVYYPTDAEPPFAAIALCGGFLNTGPEMVDWGPFYASYGIVTLITTTGALDDPGTRGDELLASIKELRGITSGPLMGKLSKRFGTSGYSMGGGGTTIATTKDTTLNSSVGLAPWSPVGAGIKTPTLLLCGSQDTVAPCNGNADGAYTQIPESTQKMKMMIDGGDHLSAWFGPQDGAGGTSGAYALAFQKVFLEGDTRWKPLLLMKPSNSTQVTNIK